MFRTNYEMYRMISILELLSLNDGCFIIIIGMEVHIMYMNHEHVMVLNMIIKKVNLGLFGVFIV